MAIAWVLFCLRNENFRALPYSLLFGYGGAWIGHFIFEKNKPAAFTQPFYSLLGDFRMFFEVVTFRRGLRDSCAS